MWRRLAAAVVVMLVPGVCWAQTGPERLLAPGSQIYFHFDGATAHKEARQKTALGKTMQGDTGKFVAALCKYVREVIDVALDKVDPQVAQLVKDAQKVALTSYRNGFAFGLEVRNIMPPEAGATLVLPKAAGDLLPLLQKLATLARAELHEHKVGQKTIREVEAGPIHVGWWNEGDDAVVVISTDEAETIAKRTQGQDYGLGKNALYKEVKEFNEFTTCCRGYLDTASLFKLVGTISPEAARLIDDLGLNGLKGITGHTGFDGLANRTIIDVHIPGPRKGLLRLASQKSISLANLPPMPPDITGFSAGSFDPPGGYEVIVQAIEAGVRIFAPDQADRVKEGIKQFEGIIGIKIGEDLFGSLGNLTVSYNSPGESLLGLGATTLIQVKDPQKLARALNGLADLVDKIPFGQVRVEKKTYQGVDLFEIHINQPGQFSLPTLAIHKGWLAFANYPQQIKGFILRANGELPAWKASKKMKETLATLPKDFTSVSVADPRQGVQLVLTALPPLLRVANSLTDQFLPEAPRFDVSLVPNPHEAVRYLFPTITVTTDHGKKIRTDVRSAL